MKSWLLTLFVVSALIASCNISIDDQGNKQKETDPSAVGFGVYMKRGVTTKAGYAGELTTDTLKKATVGFGVFGYYGNGAMYNETMKPDFMYNQWVKFTSNNVWEYSPIKYWPNEFGQAAGSEIADRLTFFAYAPYVEVTPSTGIVTDANDEDGILGMTRNISAGDPQVMYGARLQPGGGVDLCWGVAANDFTSSVDGNNNKVDKGKPFINLIKPKTGDKISFEFNHALTQLNVQIDADIDVESHADSSLDSLTRIYVRSVTFTGFTTRGSLNLNSVAGNPAWSDISGTGRLRRDPVTVYDGRSDGLEGLVTAKDINETPATLSPKVIQTSPFSVQNKDGVTNEAVNLFSYADSNSPVADVNAPVMVIPIAGVPVTVTIVYDVETADPNLAGYLSDGVTHGVSVENKITKTVQMSGQNMTLEAGKRYVIGLHLGMTSVKFDAQVAEWDDTQHKGTADLPENTASLGDIIIKDGTGTAIGNTYSMWMSEGGYTQTVTVRGVSDISNTTWSSSEPDVATIDQATGEVTLAGTGKTTITVEVTRGTLTASRSYELSVNRLTGITVTSDPVQSTVVVGKDLTMKATLEINGGQAINEPITAPTVTWGSDKSGIISVSPTTIQSQKDDQGVYYATTTATGVSAGNDVTITASIGSIEGSATLNCVDKITIASVDLGAPSTTVWLSQGASTPSVTVMGTDGNPLTSGITLAWASGNESVATVTDAGVVTLQGTGTAKLTVTATLDASATTAADTKTADYMVYVNNVTGVTIAPATSDIYKKDSLDLTATLKINDGIVNGTIATWPTVTWSSSYDKVSVKTTTSTAAQAGSAVVATMKVSAAEDAVTNTPATITAVVSTPSASSDVSGTSTLTCKDKITISSVDLGASSVTVWRYDGASVPSVTVNGSNGNPLTKGVSLSWSVKSGSSASVTPEGVISLISSGTTVLTVKATLAVSDTTAASQGTADFEINVNEVTGISINPASAAILPNGTVTLTATLTNTGFGTVSSLTPPTITWNSGTTQYVTIDPSTGMSTVATGVSAGGSSDITATVDPNYVQSGSTGSATATITCSSNPANGTGRGYTWN